MLAPHHLLVLWLKESKTILLIPLWAIGTVERLSVCTVQLYLYSPYGPYGLDRASVPVQYSYTSTPPMGRTACTEPQCLYSTAIPLLPLRTVLPVQSLSACTVQLYLYSPYGPYCLYRASVPVQYSYTSTPPMDRTACTEPQCLYRASVPVQGCTWPFLYVINFPRPVSHDVNFVCMYFICFMKNAHLWWRQCSVNYSELTLQCWLNFTADAGTRQILRTVRSLTYRLSMEDTAQPWAA